MADLVASYSEAHKDGNSAMAKADYAFGECFHGANYNITLAKFYMYRIGATVATATARLYAMTGTFGNGGKPTGAALATSDVVDLSTLGTSYGLIDFAFSGGEQYAMEAGVDYVIAIYINTRSSGTPICGVDNTSPTYEGNMSVYNFGNWNASSSDLIFYVYGDEIVVTSDIKSVNGVLIASVKEFDGLPIADVKSIVGVANS